MPVVRPKNIETTALGAAYLAGLGFGVWQSVEEIAQIWQKDKEFKVQMNRKNRVTRLNQWREAVVKA